MIDLTGEAWREALEQGLGARVVFSARGTPVSCFKAGPFRVAYPEFPVGGVCSPEIEQDVLEIVGRNVDMVRFQGRCPSSHHALLTARSLGTEVIHDLQGWNPRHWEKARRASNRQPRSPLLIRKGMSGDGAALHAMYRATLSRHGGAARYTPRYFELLAPQAALVAELEGEICGFVCVACRGTDAYYLHGAHKPEARSHYVSDQLFLAMLTKARAMRLQTFDFLPSPENQPTLSAYKQAWGARPMPFFASDVAVHALRARAIHALLALQRHGTRIGHGLRSRR